MDDSSHIGRIPSSPLHGPKAASPIRDRAARRDAKRFGEMLEDDADDEDEAAEPSTPRREPHPPADEDSGNMLDITA